MGAVLVLGSANTDLTVRAERLPRPQETVTNGEFSSSFGGKGANQALAALRAGAQTRLIARIGRDAFGERLAEHLATSGLPREGLIRDETAPAGVALIGVDREGTNQILVAPGSNKRLSPRDLHRFKHLLSGCSVFLSQLEIPLETVQSGLEAARQAGLFTVLDTAPSRELPQAIYPLLDLITPNEREATDLTGIRVDSPESARETGRILLRRGCGAALITLGGQGALFADRDREVLIPPYSVRAVDTVAAGDAYNGALAAALSEGASLLDAARFAAAAGALSTTRSGAQDSLPDREEIDALTGSSF
ncbi:MAG: ribokinase [Desulfohalobiaceae bacterium]|nr:ribokinase [Desulfohalobiaceae bacterium]